MAEMDNENEPTESGGDSLPRISARVWMSALALIAALVAVVFVLSSGSGAPSDDEAGAVSGDTQVAQARQADPEAAQPNPSSTLLSESVDDAGTESSGGELPDGVASGVVDEVGVPYFPITSNVPSVGPTTTFTPKGPTGPRVVPTTTTLAPAPPESSTTTTTTPLQPVPTTTTPPQPVPTTTTTLPQPPPVVTTTTTLPQPPPVVTTTTTLPQPPPVP